MRNIIIIVIITILGMSSTISSQVLFRSGVFLHHSTGGTIWGPNGSSTSIPQEITAYNTAKGYSDSNAVSMNEVWFPGSSLGNEWYDWHRIFDNLDPNNNIYPYLANNNIVVIKSCYPSSEMVGYGSPADTSGSNANIKTIYNYKWHLRSIVEIMENHPENFFVIWTNAPLVQEATNSSAALLSHQFTTWIKDTLAAGLDATYGDFPPNVYVFDFFHKLTNSNYYLDPNYRTGVGDSHPNAAATELVAPQFVQEIFDAAIVYESGVMLNCKVLLEGPYNGSGAMTIMLNTNNLIPLNSNSAYPTVTYGYVASTVSSIPNTDIVDWVLVELRTGASSGTKVATRAAFLKNDGMIVDIDGISPLKFAGLGEGDYFVVVRHRNHLAVMSESAISLSSSSTLFDFSTAQSQAYGTNAMKDLGGGVFGLLSGDTNNSSIITAADKSIVNSFNLSAGYYNADTNFSGIVTAADNTNINSNNLKQEFVP